MTDPRLKEASAALTQGVAAICTAAVEAAVGDEPTGFGRPIQIVAQDLHTYLDGRVLQLFLHPDAFSPAMAVECVEAYLGHALHP